MTTVLLAEDHQVVRQALRLLVDRENDLKVVGEAGDSQQALDLAGRLKPEVLVAKTLPAGLAGQEWIAEARRRAPQTRIVVVSSRDGAAEDAARAVRGGALGYLGRQSSASDLVKAIRAAGKGKRYLGAPVSERALEALLDRPAERGGDPASALTPRERMILQLSAEGNTCAEIARRLTISRRTVETHRANMLRKLRLRGQSAVVRFALEQGVVTLETVGNRAARKRARAAAPRAAKKPTGKTARRRG